MKDYNETVGGSGLHHIALRVKDFDKSVAFYKALGFEELVCWGEGDERIILLDTGNGNYLELFAGGKENENPGVMWHLAFKVDDCRKSIEVARGMGAVVTKEPREYTLGGKVPITCAFFKGPDGEELEFFQLR